MGDGDGISLALKGFVGDHLIKLNLERLFLKEAPLNTTCS
jgi:hypothetical protein